MSEFKPGDLVYHQRLGCGRIVEEWGAFVDTNPDSGKLLAASGRGIYEVEFETGGRRSVNGCRLRHLEFTVAPV